MSPAGPLPTTATVWSLVTATGGRWKSLPRRSMTMRFKLRMATAPSLSTRRQAGSQGASQTRPQIELKGLVAVMASNAASKFSSQM